MLLRSTPLLLLILTAILGQTARADYLLTLRNPYFNPTDQNYQDLSRIIRVSDSGTYLQDLVTPSSAGLNGPTGMQIDSSNILYVTNNFSGQVLRFDLSNNTQLGSFNVTDPFNAFAGPQGIQIGPDNNLYVTQMGFPMTEFDYSGAAVSVLNKANGSIVTANFGAGFTGFTGHTGPAWGTFDEAGNYHASQFSPRYDNNVPVELPRIVSLNPTNSTATTTTIPGDYVAPTGVEFHNDHLYAVYPYDGVVYDHTDNTVLLDLTSPIYAPLFGPNGLNLPAQAYFPTGIVFLNDTDFLLPSAATGLVLRFTSAGGGFFIPSLFFNPFSPEIAGTWTAAQIGYISTAGLSVADIAFVPEPATAFLALLGSGAVIRHRRARRR